MDKYKGITTYHSIDFVNYFHEISTKALILFAHGNYSIDYITKSLKRVSVDAERA